MIFNFHNKKKQLFLKQKKTCDNKYFRLYTSLSSEYEPRLPLKLAQSREYRYVDFLEIQRTDPLLQVPAAQQLHIIRNSIMLRIKFMVLTLEIGI